jgi:hypothetical protein
MIFAFLFKNFSSFFNNKIFANKFKFIISIYFSGSISSNFPKAQTQAFKITVSKLICCCSKILIKLLKSSNFVKSMLKSCNVFSSHLSEFLAIQKTS